MGYPSAKNRGFKVNLKRFCEHSKASKSPLSSQVNWVIHSMNAPVASILGLFLWHPQLAAGDRHGAEHHPTWLGHRSGKRESVGK